MSAFTRGGPLVLAAMLVAGCAAVLTTGPAAVQPGKPGQEIEGIDADGITFKLSDYHGKVVLLDFWSTH